MTIATGNVALAADVLAIATYTVRKTANETVNNSNVFQNDDHLVWAVSANEVWLIQLFLLVDAKTASRFKYTFTIPAAATLNGLLWSADSNSEYIYGDDLTASKTLTIGTAVIRCLNIQCLYVGGANAGNIQLQWAQINAVAEDTKLLTNSFLLCRKIA